MSERGAQLRHEADNGQVQCEQGLGAGWCGDGSAYNSKVAHARADAGKGSRARTSAPEPHRCSSTAPMDRRALSRASAEEALRAAKAGLRASQVPRMLWGRNEARRTQRESLLMKNVAHGRRIRRNEQSLFSRLPLVLCEGQEHRHDDRALRRLAHGNTCSSAQRTASRHPAAQRASAVRPVLKPNNERGATRR